MEFRDLRNLSHDNLFRAFWEAFIDYELQLDAEELRRMLHRRGFQAELSFGAFDQDRLVAFTFNGIGDFSGIPTAYDTGTGTIKSYRGQGLAKRIFTYSLPYLINAGIRQYLLEVLQHNEKAVALYKKLGFKVSREFYYHVQKNDRIACMERKLDPGYTIRSVDASYLRDRADFDEIQASWQNSFDSVARAIDHFRSNAVFFNDELAAYCIYEPQSGDLTRLSVSPGHRRKGIGTNLLVQVVRENTHENLKVINVPVDDHAFFAFLASKNIHPAGKQFEMILEL